MFPNFILWMLIIHILWETSENYMRYNNINKYKVSFINPISHKFAKEMEWIWMGGGKIFIFFSFMCIIYEHKIPVFFFLLFQMERKENVTMWHNRKVFHFIAGNYEDFMGMFEKLRLKFSQKRFWIRLDEICG